MKTRHFMGTAVLVILVFFLSSCDLMKLIFGGGEDEEEETPLLVSINLHGFTEVHSNQPFELDALLENADPDIPYAYQWRLNGDANPNWNMPFAYVVARCLNDNQQIDIDLEVRNPETGIVVTGSKFLPLRNSPSLVVFNQTGYELLSLKMGVPDAGYTNWGTIDQLRGNKLPAGKMAYIYNLPYGMDATYIYRKFMAEWIMAMVPVNQTSTAYDSSDDRDLMEAGYQYVFHVATPTGEYVKEPNASGIVFEMGPVVNKPFAAECQQ